VLGQKRVDYPTVGDPMSAGSRIAAATGILLLALAAPASAKPKAKTGEVLLQYCTATIGAYVNFCYGYIDAVIDNLASDQGPTPRACIPDESDEASLRDVVVGFLRRNESLRTTEAPELVVRALEEAFPCQKPK
jgi:hypothetical protein